LIGLPYTLVLALIAGFMEMVPIFGPALGAIPALMAALSTDPSKAIWVLVATGLIR
jgi:predicted PurR-regulated permease PerM